MKGKLTSLAVLLGLCAAACANADSGTRTVKTTRVIPASPEAVLDAFMDAEALASWWQVSRSLVEPETGGIWSVSWDDWGEQKTQHAWSGVIEELTPKRLVVGHLVMNEPGMPLFGPMQLEIEVERVAGGSSLTVSHHGYGYGEHWDRIYELVVSGWEHVLGDLESWAREAY